MKLMGLQKMTLLDFPKHVACTVFLGGCNFRCPFCHNFELVDGSAGVVMERAAFFSLLEKRTGILDGVCVSGGEPCMSADLPDFLRGIREMGFLVKLDTNGYCPDVLRRLLDEGLLDYVAMDIKNSPEKYAKTVGLPESGFALERIRESAAVLMASDVEYEFRTTVVSEYHTAQDFEQIGSWVTGARQYFLQRFELRDTVPDQGLSCVPEEVMHRFAKILERFVQHVALRGVE